MNIKDDKNMITPVDNLNPRKVNFNINDVLIGNLDYKFSDLFDISEIQEIQDAFSAATGVASIITEVDGTPITNPSNFCCFCNEIVRKTEKGIKNCMISDSILGSPKKDGPRIQRCLSGGLIDGGTSIMVGDKHIANWLIGQIVDSDYNTDDLLSYADEIGVERSIFEAALAKVTRMPKQQFNNICNYLFLKAHQLSKLAAKNVVQAQEIVKRERAEQEIKKLNDELEKKVLERTYQLEVINAELEETNAVLEEEISERQKAEEKIMKLNDELENKVIERTAQLQDMNAVLEEEISLQLQTEQALRESEYLLYESQKVAHIGSYVTDLKTRTWKGSPELNNILGIDETYPHTLEGWIEFIYPDLRTKLFDYHLQVEAQKERFDYEYKIIRVNDGRERWVHDLGMFEFDIQANAIRMIGTLQDITDRKEAENDIIYLSYHDKLTGLYNRRFYEEEIKRLDTERNLPISIILGDVNGLKLVNDAFGHNKGDDLLRKAAGAIQCACRADDIIARWGGDEFVILLPKTRSEEAEEVVKRIKELYLNEHVNSINVSISFGWDTKRQIDEDIIKVLKSAEDYMYKHKIIENKGMRGNTINTIINTLHEKNPREEQHSKRVSQICQSIGYAMGFSEIEVSQLKVMGLLHDIGKIAIEEGLLNKPGKLTDKEREEINRHPDIGHRILSSSYDLLELADCILAHHERWDGTGYPKGSKGEAIPRVARIISLADSYDAMTSERPYRMALSEEEALLEIRRNAGTQFDPEIARIFVEKVLYRPWD